MTRTSYLCWMITLFISQPSLADMYKCKTAQGKTTYTDQPCQKLGASTVKSVEAPTTSGLYDKEAIRKSKNGYLQTPAKTPVQVTAPTTIYKVDDNTVSATEYHAAICKGYRQNLDAIENRLRAGYQAWEANHLHQQQKFWWNKIVSECKTGEGV